MLPKYHAEITREALKYLFSEIALKKIIAANLYQDRPTGQIGHDEFHFDNNAFEQGYAYIEEQRVLVVSSLQTNNIRAAWAAFGRLTHTAQDFYAHSNYVDLWLARDGNGAGQTPSEIDPVDLALIESPALHSGKIYLPLEPFSLIKPLKPLVMPLLPRDSHAWMNLDGPEQGPKYTFAFHAAVKRTKLEYEKTIAGLSNEWITEFIDR